MGVPSEIDWMAVCLVTESNEPNEWRYIAWTVRNRVDSRRYPSTVRNVVLQPWQFSHFNAFRSFEGSDEELLEAVLAGRGTDDPVRPLNRSLYTMAKLAAMDFLTEPVWRRPFGPTVCHYWSPVSMRPRGSKPAWAAQANRLFTPANVDPNRFIYAEGVP